MAKLKWRKSGMVIGLFVAALHALWAILTALGLGERYLVWILPLNIINHLYAGVTFNLLTAVLIVIASFVGAHACVCCFVWLWNKLKMKKE
jgi:hypothetical protein